MEIASISKFWVLVSFIVCTLVLFINYRLLGFNIVTSPAWQVGLFYLALVPFGLAWFAMAVYLLFPRTGGWEWLLMGLGTLGTLILLGVFTLSWWLGGTYSGLRDQRVEDLAAVFCVASSFVVVLLSFGRCGFDRSAVPVRWVWGETTGSDSPEPVGYFPDSGSHEECCQHYHCLEVGRLCHPLEGACQPRL